MDWSVLLKAGDFWAWCHSSASIQAAWIKGGYWIGVDSSSGLLIQTSSVTFRKVALLGCP
jgi:hypothetical protein